MKGEWIIYAVSFIVILVLVGVLAWVILGLVNGLRSDDPCWTGTVFECRDSRVQECMLTEQYTKDQCVTLVGGSR